MSVSTTIKAPILNERFQIHSLLGEGGTATVYMAWDLNLRRWCALKALLCKYLSDEGMQKRFELEALTMARLEHPNIPNLIAWEPGFRPPFLVIGLARCGSSMDYVRRNGVMPVSLACDVMFQICEALQVCHEAGVIHRDIKPHNFLLDDEGNSLLTDFGIALVESEDLTKTSTQIGTFAFMAPEQRAGKPLDARADIYALGASLYTMITGKLSSELFMAAKEPDMLREVVSELREVILTACAYKPEDRYESAHVMQEAIMSALAAISIHESSYPPLVRPDSPLPEGPMERIPREGLEDLLEALGGPPKASVPPEPEPVKKDFIPYMMSSPSESSWDEGQTPSYLTPTNLYEDDIEDYPHRMDLSTTEEPAPVVIVPPKRKKQESSGVLPALTLGFVVTLLGIAVAIGGSAYLMAEAESQEREAARVFIKELNNSGAVVYQIPGDRSQYEEIYARVAASRGDEKLSYAVDFADALSKAPSTTKPSAVTQIEAIVHARDQYLEARQRWVSASKELPGSVAVRLGISRPPHELPKP